MWLIDVRTYELKYFHNENQVEYAILSHRWEDQEISHKDMLSMSTQVKTMKGWYKIQKCCEQAAKDELRYAWVDTCCIDKSSSAELQEAINSMFRWYRQAVVCYAYLSDVDDTYGKQDQADDHNQHEVLWRSFRHSQWFQRGWTLQELIAPKKLEFLDLNWRPLGNRPHLAKLVREITGVSSAILKYGYGDRPCIAVIMCWASGRKTTRIEDRAYSLLGLFSITMPLLYGEGEMAFIRLQEEILRRSDDQSIFAWSGPTMLENPEVEPGLLAKSPDQFSALPPSYTYLHPEKFPRRAAHTITNEGIALELLLFSVRPRVYLASLNSSITGSAPATGLSYSTYQSCTCIHLKRIDATRYARWGIETTAEHPNLECAGWFRSGGHVEKTAQGQLRQVTVVTLLKQHERERLLVDRLPAFKMLNDQPVPKKSRKGILVCLPETSCPDKRINTCERPCSFAGVVRLQPFGYIYNTPDIEVKTLWFGFDFDFNPVCVFMNRETTNENSEFLERRLPESVGYRSDPFPSKMGYLVLRVDGGEWKDFGGGILAVRCTLETLLSGRGFLVDLKAASSESSHGGQIKVTVRENAQLGVWTANVVASVW